MLCVCVCFFSIVLLFLMCFVCLYSLKLCQQAQGVPCNCRCFAFHFATTPCAYLSFVRLLESLLLAIHFQYSPHFFGTTIMEFSIPNTFRMETKLNDLCVGVGHLIGCNCNNIVNRLEQEAPCEALFEALSNIGIDDLILQDIVEELENMQSFGCVPKVTLGPSSK